VILYFTTLITLSFIAFPVILVTTIMGRRYDANMVIARLFYFITSWLLDIEIEVEGSEHLETNPAIFVGNHQSAVDILYLGRIFPRRCSIMAKKQLKVVPVLGQWMSLSGAVFVDRGNSKHAMQSLERASADINNRSLSIWIFPEGTRTSSETPNILPFKKGAFHLAVKAGVPVVPVVCENYWRLYRKGVFESGKLKVKVLPPIQTSGMMASDVTNLAVSTREMMLTALKEISEPVGESVATVDNDNASLEKETPPLAEPIGTLLGHTGVPGPITSDQSMSEVGKEATRDDSRDHRDSATESSATDDEMVMVDRPT